LEYFGPPPLSVLFETLTRFAETYLFEASEPSLGVFEGRTTLLLLIG